MNLELGLLGDFVSSCLSHCIDITENSSAGLKKCSGEEKAVWDKIT